MKLRIVLAVLMLSAWASAGIVIGVADPLESNCIPWSCQDQFPGGYQQIYYGTAFSGPITISSIEFFNTMLNNGPNQGVAQIAGSIYLSVTSQTDPDGTMPGSAVLFSTGALYGQNWPFGKTLDIGGAPFYYDPALGNLELIIVPTSEGGPLSGVNTFFDAGFNNPFSRWCPACGPNDGYGLVTGFNYTGTPEPSSLALLGTGVLGLAGTLRRKLMR